MNEIPTQRHRFNIPADVAYFNCAYMAPLATEVLHAVESGAALKASPWTYHPADFFAHTERARCALAAVAGCDSDQLALVPSASYGLAIAARNVPLDKGQRILVLADQFPSNVYVWREKAVAVGATLETVQRSPDENWTSALCRAIGDGVAIVAIPHCHWADGGIVDLVRVAEACRSSGAALVIDATQSLGALPIDFALVKPDFVVAAGYKWLMAPYGTGMLFAQPKYNDGAPIEHNWINRAGSEDFSRLVDYRDDFQSGARRFDMGEKANPPLLAGVATAAAMLLDWGVERIAETLGAKTERIAVSATQVGWQVAAKSDRSPHILSLRHSGSLPENIGTNLAAKNVFVSIRGQSLRIAPHVYNDEADIERLIDALQVF